MHGGQGSASKARCSFGRLQGAARLTSVAAAAAFVALSGCRGGGLAEPNGPAGWEVEAASLRVGVVGEPASAPDCVAESADPTAARFFFPPFLLISEEDGTLHGNGATVSVSADGSVATIKPPDVGNVQPPAGAGEDGAPDSHPDDSGDPAAEAGGTGETGKIRGTREAGMTAELGEIQEPFDETNDTSEAGDQGRDHGRETGSDGEGRSFGEAVAAQWRAVLAWPAPDPVIRVADAIEGGGDYARGFADWEDVGVELREDGALDVQLAGDARARVRTLAHPILGIGAGFDRTVAREDAPGELLGVPPAPRLELFDGHSEVWERLAGGDLDGALLPGRAKPPEEVVAAVPGMSVEWVTGTTFEYAVFNTARPPFASTDNRKAVASALREVTLDPPEGFARAPSLLRGAPETQVFAGREEGDAGREDAAGPAAEDAGRQILEHGPDEDGTEELAEFEPSAGSPPVPSPAFDREWDDREADVELLAVDSEHGRSVAGAVVDCLEGADISVAVRLRSGSAFMEALQKRYFDIAVLRRATATGDPAELYAPFRSRDHRNDSGYRREAVDTALAVVERMVPGPRRREALASVERMVMEEDAALVPLFREKHTLVARTDRAWVAGAREEPPRRSPTDKPAEIPRTAWELQRQGAWEERAARSPRVEISVDRFGSLALRER